MLDDIAAAEAVIDTLNVEQIAHVRAIKALDTGEVGPDASELKKGCAEAHNLASTLRKSDPDLAVATEGLKLAKDALAKAEFAMRDSEALLQGIDAPVQQARKLNFHCGAIA